MSALLRLLCDHQFPNRDRCGRELVYAHDGRGHDITAARAWALTQGWTHRGEEDFCPRHGDHARPRLRLDLTDDTPAIAWAPTAPARAAS